jgi:hypothetical protein
MRNKFFLMEEAGDNAGGGGGAQFDPVAFEKKMTDTMNATFNGFAKNLKTEITKMIPKPKDGDGGDGGDPPPGDDKSKPAGDLRLQRKLEQLEKDLANERAAREKTEASAKETNRRAELSKALNGIPFANEKAALAAQRLFDADVRYNDAGELVAGPDELPVGEYIKAQMRDHEYLLAPKQTGGSGASPGKQGAGKALTLDDIKPGMSDESRTALAAQIKSVAGQ